MTIAKHRCDTASQSIDIAWHVSLGDTSGQILHKLQEIMSETRHARESVPVRVILASVFNEITNWEKTEGAKQMSSSSE